jgi:hypothetical protein
MRSPAIIGKKNTISLLHQLGTGYSTARNQRQDDGKKIVQPLWLAYVK